MSLSYQKINIIVAINNDSLIGIKEYGFHTLPWPSINDDMNHFRKIITNTSNEKKNAIIVGYNTWITLPITYKTNPNLHHVIISKNHLYNISNYNENYVESFDLALDLINTFHNINQIFVIGGAYVYQSALLHPKLSTIYLTHIDNTYPKDNIIEQKVYFPLNISLFDRFVEQSYFEEIDASLMGYKTHKRHDMSKNISYTFRFYHVHNPQFSTMYKEFMNTYSTSLIVNIPNSMNSNLKPTLDSWEWQYIQLIQHIMDNGIIKNTRNSITRSIFGYQLQCDLNKGFPLLTVKKTYFKSIFEELMWMIRGETNVKKLQEKNVHIWDKNSSKEYLRKYNLPYEEGDIGPGYGFQMRYYGAKYISCHSNYHGQGIDQLQRCIYLIKNEPYSRRIIIDLWNAIDMDRQALPPCHVIYNFGVDLYDKPKLGIKGKLNCHLFQRSWDVLLGWNLTTAALLTCLLAHHCNLDPGILIHSISDAHIYQDHIDSGAVNELLNRTPRKSPSLKILNARDRIEDYQYDDLMLENYYPCPIIKMTMIA